MDQSAWPQDSSERLGGRWPRAADLSPRTSRVGGGRPGWRPAERPQGVGVKGQVLGLTWLLVSPWTLLSRSLTDDICKDPLSKLGQILRFRWTGTLGGTYSTPTFTNRQAQSLFLWPVPNLPEGRGPAPPRLPWRGSGVRPLGQADLLSRECLRGWTWPGGADTALFFHLRASSVSESTQLGPWVLAGGGSSPSCSLKIEGKADARRALRYWLSGVWWLLGSSAAHRSLRHLTLNLPRSL